MSRNELFFDEKTDEIVFRLREVLLYEFTHVR